MQVEEWKNKSWLRCEKLGYYMSGILSTGNALHDIDSIFCCRPKLLATDDNPV
jgi:hypothetical protein